MRRLLLLAGLAVIAVPAPAGAVIGGSAAGPGVAPWATALVSHGARDARSGQFCAGSVIAPMFVLTAAHCTGNRTAAGIDVVTGRTHLTGTEGQRIRVAAFAVSPDWVPSALRHDVAVLTLAAPTSSPPIGIAGPANGTIVRPGVSLLATGWGRQNEAPGTGSVDLAQATLTLRPEDGCSRIYRQFDATMMLCAGGRGATATCRGDSGGAVVGFYGPTPLIAGLVSFGTAHCADGSPRAYARVPTEAGWIAATAGLPAPPAPATVQPRIKRAKCRPGSCAVDVVLAGDDSGVGSVSVRVAGVASPFQALPTATDWRADFQVDRPAARVSAQALDAASRPLGPAARTTVR